MCIAATNSAGVAKKVDRLLIGFATDLPDLFFADFMRWPVHFKLSSGVAYWPRAVFVARTDLVAIGGKADAAGSRADDAIDPKRRFATVN